MNRFASSKTLVVTGGKGFIGSHFISKMLQQGHKIINIDVETYAANLINEFDNHPMYKHIKADISEITTLPFCHIIVNFAAESHVDNSIANASNFIKTNVLGVHNLLEIIKNTKLQNMLTSWNYTAPLFVQVSTDEVFGDILAGSFLEEDRHMPSNPYSATKSCAEMLVKAWARTYGINTIITRTTNNYGPRQHSEKLIPAAITKLLAGKNVTVHGDGRYVRNWIHVEDNVDALIMIIDKGELDSTYHVSSDEEFSVREIVTMIADKFGKTYDEVVDDTTDRNGCDERYALNCEKLKALGWTQKRQMKDQILPLIDVFRNKP